MFQTDSCEWFVFVMLYLWSVIFFVSGYGVKYV